MNRMASDAPQAMSTGMRCLAGGRRSGPTPPVATRRSSRFCVRYEARNTTMRTLPISEGWNPIGPSLTHSRAPLIVRPIPGTTGSRRSTRPRSPIEYVNASSCRWSRTKNSVAQNAASPIATHVACSAAKPPERRKIIANPSPVEDGRGREQGRVRVRRVSADREGRRGIPEPEDRAVQHDGDRHVSPLAQAGEHVCAHRDDEREDRERDRRPLPGPSLGDRGLAQPLGPGVAPLACARSLWICSTIASAAVRSSAVMPWSRSR